MKETQDCLTIIHATPEALFILDKGISYNSNLFTTSESYTKALVQRVSEYVRNKKTIIFALYGRSELPNELQTFKDHIQTIPPYFLQPINATQAKDLDTMYKEQSIKTIEFVGGWAHACLGDIFQRVIGADQQVVFLSFMRREQEITAHNVFSTLKCQGKPRHNVRVNRDLVF